MTIRDVYENCLIELNKVLAPSLLVKDFIYLYNKAVQMVFNKRYTLFEVNQQLTDDLRVLSKTVKIVPTGASGPVFGLSYDCLLPDDYVHILNCICEFTDNGDPNKKCKGKPTTVVFQQGAHKLDSNQWATVINNWYMRPSVKQPYYYIINIDNPSDLNTIVADSDKQKLVGRGQEQRYGNSVQPIMLIKCGNDPRFTLSCVYIDYLRQPEYLSIDQDILDEPADSSQVLEYPTYICYEIINQIVTLVMENAKDDRTKSFMQVSLSIPQK